MLHRRPSGTLPTLMGCQSRDLGSVGVKCHRELVNADVGRTDGLTG